MHVFLCLSLILKQQRIKNVLPDPNGLNSKRLILLSPSAVTASNVIPLAVQELVEVNKRLEVIPNYELTINYNELSYGNSYCFPSCFRILFFWHAQTECLQTKLFPFLFLFPLFLSFLDEALRSLLPPSLEVCSAFERIGHIAHVNLKDSHLPYKYAIGQILLDVRKYNTNILLLLLFSILSSV